MKKVLLSLLVLATTLGATAQKTAIKQTSAAPQSVAIAQPKMSKEQKEANLVEAFKKAELTDDQQKAARSVLDASNEKSKAVKNDASISEEDKKSKLDEVYKEKNEKLKEVMGEAKHKVFKQTQKAQKDAAAVMPASPVKEIN